MENWELLFQTEINHAYTARLEGNEGKARVCARRAANILIQQYFKEQQLYYSKNAIKNLTSLQSHIHPSHPAQGLITNLLLRVDENFKLPSGIDLVADVLQLKDFLFPH